VSASDDAFICHRDVARAEQEMTDAIARYRKAERSNDAVAGAVAFADWQVAQMVSDTAANQLHAALSEFDAELEAGL
jgi:hypothetical protein